jgi:hypothetical protein
MAVSIAGNPVEIRTAISSMSVALDEQSVNTDGAWLDNVTVLS